MFASFSRLFNTSCLFQPVAAELCPSFSVLCSHSSSYVLTDVDSFESVNVRLSVVHFLVFRSCRVLLSS